MARVIKEHAVRRGEILDVAQRLVYSKGYEQMTVQDILDGLQISKGAFYHYFGSKPALLEALIERMLGEAEQLLIPIVHDRHLPALEKLQLYFSTAARWKTARKSFLLALLRVWYTDDNAIVRQKMQATGIQRITPLLSAIIHQGVQEGTFTTFHPDQVGEVVLSLMQGLGDSYSRAILSFEPGSGDPGCLDGTVAAYTDAVERVLGAPSGSLTLVDSETTREWLAPEDATPNGEGQQWTVRA